MDLYTKEREGKLNADCQSRSLMPSTSAEPSSSPWVAGEADGAGEAGGGRRGRWGQARPMGAVSHRLHVRSVRPNTTKATGPNPVPTLANMAVQR